MHPKQPHFSASLFRFLRELQANNDRDWFHANKDRYEDHVREPALRFISDFGPRLKTISPHFRAIPKKVGGSLFRIHRDVRFSSDKSPYKTSVGIHFRHKEAKNAHAPGFYLHLAPGESFAGAGIWHPEKEALAQIRAGIDQRAKDWKRATTAKRFTETFELQGESLKRAPKGFDTDHPMIGDLKRKDFIGIHSLTQKGLTQADFLSNYTALMKSSSAFMKLLCEFLDVDF